MRIICLFVTFIIASCTSKNLPGDITADSSLSELQFNEDDKSDDFSIVEGNFFTNDSTNFWYAIDSSKLNVCACLLENDTLQIIIGHITVFEGIYSTFQISNEHFLNRILDSGCTDDSYSSTINSELALNMLNFNMGDTLFGQFKSTGFASKVDTTKLQNFNGKFRCLVSEGSW